MERIVLKFGFMQRLNIPQALTDNAAALDLTQEMLDGMIYFVGRETILPSARVPGMAVWREGVFAAMQRNAERSANYFCIPAGTVGRGGHRGRDLTRRQNLHVTAHGEHVHRPRARG